MKLVAKANLVETDQGTALGTGDIFEFTVIDADTYGSFSSFTLVYAAGTPNELTLTASGTNPPQFVKANGDIRLDNIVTLESITVAFNTSVSGKVLMAISVDGDTTWKAWNGVDTWVTVDTTVLTDVDSKGMNQTTVNALTATQLETLRGVSDTIRFGYYISEAAVNESISLDVEMEARKEIATQSEFEYSLHPYGDELVYDFTFTGTKTFVINYVESGVVE